MTTGNRLTDAIVTRAGYLANELEAGDNEGALAQLAKINEFASRILVSIAGSTVDVTDPGEPLSSNPSVAIHQLLAAVGHPTTLNEAGESVAVDPAAVASAASPQQNRELGLLGFWGVGPNRFADGDHSLRDQYYRNDGAIPLDPDLNAWADYLSKA